MEFREPPPASKITRREVYHRQAMSILNSDMPESEKADWITAWMETAASLSEIYATQMINPGEPHGSRPDQR